jgi:hypothetical protein
VPPPSGADNAKTRRLFDNAVFEAVLVRPLQRGWRPLTYRKPPDLLSSSRRFEYGDLALMTSQAQRGRVMDV